VTDSRSRQSIPQSLGRDRRPLKDQDERNTSGTKTEKNFTVLPGGNEWGISRGMPVPSSWLIPLLFILNLALQCWDGIATYCGLAMGVQEGNPLVRAAIEHLGVGYALLSVKGLACGLVFVLRACSQSVLCVQGLWLTAVSYVVFSFVPWCLLFLG
jgi:hypothetical protein